MAIRVTRPITKYGRYYPLGEVIDDPSSAELSLARVWRWETVTEKKSSLHGMRKPELVDLAHERGVDVSGFTVKQIIDTLE